MVQSISNRVVGKMASVLFLASGSISVVSVVLPARPGTNRAGEVGVGLAALAVGGFAWFASWQRWRRSASLWLVPAAFAVLDATVLTGSQDNRTFAVYFVVVFAWVGVGHPRWTAARLLPLAVLAYSLPLTLSGHGRGALDSLFEVAILCLLVGETLAWVSAKLRTIEAVDERRVYEMQMLLRAAELLARESEPSRLPRLTAELAVQLLRTEAALVLLFEDEQTLRSVGAYLWPADATEVAMVPPPKLRRALESGGASLVEREAFDKGPLAGLPYPSLLVLPLAGTARPQGILIAGLRDETTRLDDFSEGVALTFATQAGLALERVRAVHALLDESLRDELTGLGNRKSANVALSTVAQGDALVVIDLDYFKELNDTHGHAAGDDTLRMLAAHLRTALREDDVAARLGGDEFLLVLRGARENALPTVNRLERQWLASQASVTYSAGIAVNIAEESAEQTLARADAALYAAKQQGRARASLAS